MIGLTLQLKEVERAWFESPRGEKRAVKEFRSNVLGLSSLTTTQVLTQERSTPLVFSRDVLLPSC